MHGRKGKRIGDNKQNKQDKAAFQEADNTACHPVDKGKDRQLCHVVNGASNKANDQPVSEARIKKAMTLYNPCWTKGSSPIAEKDPAD